MGKRNINRSDQFINYEHVLDAVNTVNGSRPADWNTSAISRQLVQSLELYKERGEFDGTMDSAIECLILCGFIEVDDE